MSRSELEKAREPFREFLTEKEMILLEELLRSLAEIEYECYEDEQKLKAILDYEVLFP